MKNLKSLMMIGCCFLISFALNAQDIDPDYYYRMTNSFLKEGRSLDTYSDGKNEPFMGKTGNYSGQYWKLTALGNGYYRLTNSFLKEGRSLDTYSDGKNVPFMGNTGNYSGQMWKLTKLNKIKPVKEDIVEAKPQLDADVKGMNVNVVEFNDGKTTGLFKQTSLKKWEEYDTKGKKKFQFEETGRDEWSVYMIDKSRGGMRIALDLWQKKVKIDGKPYYNITKASAVTNGVNVKAVTFDSKSTKGTFRQTGSKKWGEYDTNGKQKWRFDETARDEWSVYLIDNMRGGMKIQLDLHTKNVLIDGKAYYKITESTR